MSSLDLQDIRRDFSFSLCAAPLSGSCPKILEDRGLERGLEFVLGVELRE